MSGFIRRRAKGSWEVSVETGRDPATGKRRRRTQTIKGTRREAEALQAALIHQLETGIDIDPGRLTLADYLERWLTAIKPNLAPATFARYSGLVHVQITPRLGSVNLAKLRPLHVQTLYAELQDHGRIDGRGLAPRTLLHVHRVLSEALSQAVRWQMLARNVCDAVESPHARRAEMRFLNAQDTRQLLATAEASSSPYDAASALAVHTGLRQGELLGLHWDDVDIASGNVSIRTALQWLPGEPFALREPKTARGRRIVSLGDAAIDVLRRARTRQLEDRLTLGAAWQDHGLVFTTRVGTPLNHWNLRRAFYSLLRRANLPHIRFHDLRHTHASLMLARGIHPKVVSERLGHSSVGLTLDTYSHVVPNLQKDAARAFDEWLMNPPAEQSAQKN